MIWEDKKTTKNILRIFLALVFLSAGIFRIVNPGLAGIEMVELNLPEFLVWPVILLEVLGGLGLLLNKYVKEITIVFILLMMVALTIGLLDNGGTIIKQGKELFAFNTEPTDLFLHATFLVILFAVLFGRK